LCEGINEQLNIKNAFYNWIVYIQTRKYGKYW
jgi:hypothetical protein